MVLRKRDKSTEERQPKPKLLKDTVLLLNYTTDEIAKMLEIKSNENPFLKVEWTNDYYSLSEQVDADTPNADQEDIPSLVEKIPNKINQSQSLIAHLLDQVDIYMRETYLRDIVLYMLDYIDDRGYLLADLEDIERRTGADKLQVLDALTLIQLLDPAGVGARDERECYLIQVLNDPEAAIGAQEIIENYYDDFIEGRADRIKESLQMDEDQYDTAIDYLSRLSLNPGAAYAKSKGPSLDPVASAKKVEDGIELRYFYQLMPRLSFDESYYQEIAESDDPEVKCYAKQQKDDALKLIQSLKKREELIMAVMKVIVKKQWHYLKGEKDQIEDLYLREIADAADLRLSTVNRIISRHALVTDRGIIALKDLISTQ